MFKEGDIVLCIEDFSENNTGRKIGMVIGRDTSSCHVGFYEELYRTNDMVTRFKEIKSVWWIPEKLLRKAVTFTKFK